MGRETSVDGRFPMYCTEISQLVGFPCEREREREKSALGDSARAWGGDDDDDDTALTALQLAVIGAPPPARSSSFFSLTQRCKDLIATRNRVTRYVAS